MQQLCTSYSLTVPYKNCTPHKNNSKSGKPDHTGQGRKEKKRKEKKRKEKKRPTGPFSRRCERRWVSKPETRRLLS